MIEGTTAAVGDKPRSTVLDRFKERFELECTIMRLEDLIRCGDLSPDLLKKCQKLLRTYKKARGEK